MMDSVIEINLDKHRIPFTPSEIAVHPDDGVGRLACTLGPRYVPPIWAGRVCPPNVQIVKVVTDPAVTRGLAEVRRPEGRFMTLTLVRW